MATALLVVLACLLVRSSGGVARLGAAARLPQDRRGDPKVPVDSSTWGNTDALATSRRK